MVYGTIDKLNFNNIKAKEKEFEFLGEFPQYNIAVYLNMIIIDRDDIINPHYIFLS